MDQAIADRLGRQRARVIAPSVAIALGAFILAGRPHLALFAALAGVIASMSDAPTSGRGRLEGVLAVLGVAGVSAGLGMLAARSETLIIVGTLAGAAAASTVPMDHRVLAFGARYATIAFNVGAHQPIGTLTVLAAFAIGAAVSCALVLADARVVAARGPSARSAGPGDAGLRADWIAVRGGSRNPWPFVAFASATVATSLLFADTIRLEKPYWVMLTTLVVMHPNPSAGLRRIAERGGGVIAGTILTAGISTIHAVPVLVVVAVVLAASAPLAFAKNYGAGCALVTMLVLVLFDVTIENARGAPYLWPRVLDTLVGCGFALVGTFVAWGFSRLRP